MDLGINNKVALVTGSNRGTGLMIAEQLAAEGARVIFHSQTEGDSAAIAEQVENASAVWGDISTEQGSEQVIRAVNELNYGVDILVNNYGIGRSWSLANSHQRRLAYRVPKKHPVNCPHGSRVHSWYDQGRLGTGREPRHCWVNSAE